MAFQFENPNPNYDHQYHSTQDIDPFSFMEFEWSDSLLFHDGIDRASSTSQSMVSSEKVTGVDSGSSGTINGATSKNSNMKCEKEVKNNITKHMMDEGDGRRVAFRTKSELEIMDDGFKWRKYGKKAVKNSPNPRNYYKCANGGCNVKKRVERDREDASYVITCYDGVHNHESPCIVYYNQMPLLVPTSAHWTTFNPPPDSSTSS